MDFFKAGKYTSTHGLKGEIKILSNLSDMSDSFKIGNIIYIGEFKKPFKIASYRHHQKYDMLTLETLDSIDKVLPYKGNDVFLDKNDINIPLIDNLTNYKVYNNGIDIGLVIEILKGVKNDFIVVSEKRIIIPFIDNFIVSIDSDKKIIYTNYMI